MLSANNVTVRFGKRVLFEEVNIRFGKGNCYGIIGANGAGKSTFLKVLSGEIEPSKGDVSIDKGERLSMLKQDHFAYDDQEVLKTVMMGNKRLFEIMQRKEELYSKPDFNDADGLELADLEGEFLEMDGWNAETDAEILLNGLGVTTEYHSLLMKDLGDQQKVKVLLAQALFGNPDVLLLDEPTNDLDLKSINWLQDFLMDFENTVIVVSHDRYFLNKVCTHIADVDFGKIKVYPGNYDFWYESSQLALKQAREQNKKKEEKIKELQDFIARFSANASKSKQATSRKKTLEKIELDEIKPSNRKYPYVDFKPDREPGKEILQVKNISKTVDGVKVLDKISFDVKQGDKIAFLADNENAKTILFQIISGELEPDEGELVWGTTITQNYFPKDNNYLFDTNENVTEPVDEDLKRVVTGVVDIVTAKMDELRVADALTEIMNLFKRCNKYIDETTPWILAKEEASKPRLATVLYHLVESITIGASLLKSFMPETSEKILSQLNAFEVPFDELGSFGHYGSGTKVTSQPEILFERMKLEDVLAKVEELYPEAEEPEQKVEDGIDVEPKAEIEYDDFMKMQFQVGEIISCEAVPKSKKLLCSQVRIGSQVKQIVSGIRKHYSPEEMVGKKVMVLVNLKPAKLAGVLSEGMLLCAENAEGELALVAPEKDMPSGAEIC